MAKTLHYNFLTNPSLTDHTTGTATPDLSITRATKATMVDADGYIREVQAGEARFTGATFTHNRVQRSEEFDNAYWTKSEITIDPNTSETTDPNGGNTADKATMSGSGNQRVFRVGGVANGWLLMSMYAKAGTHPYVAFRDAGSGDAWQVFDLSDGTLGTQGALIQSAAISDEGNGWYRCSALINTAAASNTDWGIYGTAAKDSLNGVSSTATDYFYIWGAQSEKVTTSSATVGTYISTTTTAVSSLSGTSTQGLLVEEARTNICLQSEDITQFTAGNSSPVADQATSPDGSTTADQLVDNSATGTGVVQVSQSITVATSTVYTFSAFLKADQLSWAHLAVTALDVLAIDQYYDLNNGVVGSSPGANVDDSGIEDYGNGWYRCWLTFTSHGTDTSGVLRIQCADADSDNTVDLDGTSSIFVWGAQLEAGAFPTSYIATTTTSVTRNADVVSTTDMSWADESQGTFYANAVDPYAVAQGFVFEWQVNSANRQLFAEAGTATTFQTYGQTSTLQWQIQKVSAITANVAFKAVYAYATNDIAFYIDGASGGTDTSATPPTGLTTFDVGRSGTGGNGYWNGHIAEVAYFNERLANATLLDYSTNGLPTAFPGTVAGDGGHIWPPRANDPRWTQIITDSGITASGNFIDDVHEALEALASTTGAMDDLWKKFKAAYSVTDTSEPFTY